MNRKEEARGQLQLSNGPERIAYMKKYIIPTRVLTILAVISVLLMLAMAGLNIWQDEQNRRSVWTGSYPMANQHIEWTGAGYQPIVIPEE